MYLLNFIYFRACLSTGIANQLRTIFFIFFYFSFFCWFHRGRQVMLSTQIYTLLKNCSHIQASPPLNVVYKSNLKCLFNAFLGHSHLYLSTCYHSCNIQYVSINWNMQERCHFKRDLIESFKGLIYLVIKQNDRDLASKLSISMDCRALEECWPPPIPPSPALSQGGGGCRNSYIRPQPHAFQIYTVS